MAEEASWGGGARRGRPGLRDPGVRHQRLSVVFAASSCHSASLILIFAFRITRQADDPTRRTLCPPVPATLCDRRSPDAPKTCGRPQCPFFSERSKRSFQ
jgi:hypothetical protein